MRRRETQRVPYDSIDRLINHIEEVRETKSYVRFIENFVHFTEAALNNPDPQLLHRLNQPYQNRDKSIGEYARIVIDDLHEAEEVGVIGITLIDDPEEDFIQTAQFKDTHDPNTPIVLAIMLNLSGQEGIKWHKRMSPDADSLFVAINFIAEMGMALDDLKVTEPERILVPRQHHDIALS